MRKTKPSLSLIYPALIRALCAAQGVPMERFEMNLQMGAPIRLPVDNLDAPYKFHPCGEAEEAEQSTAPPVPTRPQRQQTQRGKGIKRKRTTVTIQEPASASQPIPPGPTDAYVPEPIVPEGQTSGRENPPEESRQQTTKTVEQFQAEMSANYTEFTSRIELTLQESTKQNKEFQDSMTEAVKKLIESNAAADRRHEESIQAQNQNIALLQQLVMALVPTSLPTQPPASSAAPSSSIPPTNPPADPEHRQQ